MIKDEPASTPEQAPTQRPGWLSVIASVGAGLFGVQSSKNRERDFEAGKPGDYVLVGVIAVVLFVLGLIGVVKWILADAGL